LDGGPLERRLPRITAQGYAVSRAMHSHGGKVGVPLDSLTGGRASAVPRGTVG